VATLPRGRCGYDEDHRGAVERRNGAGEAVPRVFANEHRGASPFRIERANLESAIDETFFVEQSVGR
jgi:hypothetical protein